MDTVAAGNCPLTAREQTRNLVIYGINVSLIYLAAPVLYVGLTQAALCEKLGTSETVANLPASVYFWLTPLPIVAAWYFSAVRMLKPVLVTTYLIIAGTGVLVAAALVWPTPTWVGDTLTTLACWLPSKLRPPPDWVIPALLLQAAVLGCALGLVSTLQWEVLGRGVAETRRGKALALAYGVGPAMAVIGSLGSQILLDGKLGNLSFGEIPYPRNFAALFAASAPIMILAAWLATCFVVPQPPIEVARKPFVSGVFGGFSEFFSYRLIQIAALGMILVASGYNILPNISLYTQEATGEPAEKLVGYQNALRFGFKIFAGLILGWFLTKTNPKAGLLITAGFCLASVLWALLAPRAWIHVGTAAIPIFLVSFALMGAGELFGVYYPNYILSCSARSRMRRNMALTSMLNMPSGFAALLFGFVAHDYGIRWSFVLSIVILAATILLVQIGLPARPSPRESDMDSSDRAPGRSAASEDPAV
jgi:MFS family permease